jgi:3-methyladenine DNA glycosylase AlkD
MKPREFVAAVEAALLPLANPDRAESMQAYLRDQFPCLGIAAPERRAAVKHLMRVELNDDTLMASAAMLWKRREREFRYTAADLLRQHAKLLDTDHIQQLKPFVLDEPWWETVDALGSVVNDVMHRLRQETGKGQWLMDQWMISKSNWVRRIAMTHQLGWRLDTNTERLELYAEKLAPEPDVFIQKAVVWALRDYARYNPSFIKRFLRDRGYVLTPYIVREVRKALPQPNQVKAPG